MVCIELVLAWSNNVTACRTEALFTTNLFQGPFLITLFIPSSAFSLGLEVMGPINHKHFYLFLHCVNFTQFTSRIFKWKFLGSDELCQDAKACKELQRNYSATTTFFFHCQQTRKATSYNRTSFTFYEKVKLELLSGSQHTFPFSLGV